MQKINFSPIINKRNYIFENNILVDQNKNDNIILKYQ